MKARKRKKLLTLFRATYYRDDPNDPVYDEHEEEFIHLVREGYFDRELVRVTGNNKLDVVRRRSRSPLSGKGQHELDTSAYERFRGSLPMRILRDVALVVAFALSVYLTIQSIFGN